MDPDIITKVAVSGNGTTDYDIALDVEPPGLNITPRRAWPASASISVTVQGGAGGARDASGNLLAADRTVTITTAAADATKAIFDQDTSAFKAGMVDVDPYNWGSFLNFTKSGRPAFLDLQGGILQHFSLVEKDTSIPVKGFEIEEHHSENTVQFQTMPGMYGLKNGQTYTLTIKSTLLDSELTAFAQASYDFTTAGGNQTRPTVWNTPEVQVQTSDSGGGVGQKLDLRTDLSNQGTADLLSVTVTSSPGTFSDSQDGGSPANGYQYEYSTPGDDEANIANNSGALTFTFAYSDGQLTHDFSVESWGYVFQNANLPTMSVSDTANGRPTFTWANVPMSGADLGTGLVILIMDNSGNQLAMFIMDMAASGSFTLPEESTLAAGNYMAVAAVYKTQGGIMRGMGSIGAGGAPFTVP